MRLGIWGMNKLLQAWRKPWPWYSVVKPRPLGGPVATAHDHRAEEGRGDDGAGVMGVFYAPPDFADWLG